MQRLFVLLAAVLLLMGPGATADRFIELPTSVPCFTGIAELEMVQNDCPPLLQPLGNLSSPFDPRYHVPWDCLSNMMASVEGCMVSMVSQNQMSETLFNFSCTWIQLQGNMINATHARMASWIRPSPVARFVLSTADLEIAAADLTNPPKPAGWQDRLSDMIRESSMLMVDPAMPGRVILSQFGGQCNSSFQVKSGGMMGVGKVNSSTLGMIVMPSMAPFTQPFVVRGQRDFSMWRQRARAWFIALVVMVGIFALMLLSCIGILAHRLIKAGMQKRNPNHIATTPFEDGIGRYDTGHQQEIGQGAVSIENQTRRHGATGGL